MIFLLFQVTSIAVVITPTPVSRTELISHESRINKVIKENRTNIIAGE